MLFPHMLLLLLLLPGVAVAEVILNFDPSLEGKVGTIEVLDTVVDNAYGESKFEPKPSGSEAFVSGDQAAIHSPRGALEALVNKRQSCPTGYGYCASFGRCCPMTNTCCPYGYCLPPQASCCPNGPCLDGKACCGFSHCAPADATCCRDESFCERGNTCVLVAGETRPRCCTDLRCTAHVVNGITTSATTRTTTATVTTTSWRYYYWTVTWYYYSYYWSYSVRIEASVVTSTRRTTSTVFSVSTTAASAASSYFSSVSSTLVLPTPAAATSLASLTGSTSFLRSSTAPPSSATGGSGSGSGSGLGGAGANGTNSTSGAPGRRGDLAAGLDGFVSAWLVAGLAVGIAAMLL